jgi:hypothetical protein
MIGCKRGLFCTAAISSGLLWAAGAAAQERQGPVDLLPLLNVDRETEPPTGESAVGGYVRFWVSRVQPPPEVGPREVGSRDYRRERRTWLSRFIVGRHRSRILQARVTISNPNINASLTLASTSQTSNRTDGENFASEVGHRRFFTPYVRIDPGTTVGVEFSLAASSTVNPDVTANILDIVQRGARLAAPTGTVVTALNSERLRAASNFVDQSISSLFGEKLSEKSLTDFSPDQWTASGARRGEGSRLATVTALFPMGGHVWTQGANRDVGSWEVRVSDPVVSVFSTMPLIAAPDTETPGRCAGDEFSEPERQACRAFIGLAPTSVFGFRVGENQTLGESLRGDAGITAALARFKEANEDEQAAIAMCNLVAAKAHWLGLNRFDAAVAVWAFAELGDLRPAVAVKMVSNVCAAGALGQRLGLSVTAPSAGPAPADPPAKP